MLLAKVGTVIRLADTALRAMVVRVRSDVPLTQLWCYLLFFCLARYVSPLVVRSPLHDLAAVSVRARGKLGLFQSSSLSIISLASSNQLQRRYPHKRFRDTLLNYRNFLTGQLIWGKWICRRTGRRSIKSNSESGSLRADGAWPATGDLRHPPRVVWDSSASLDRDASHELAKG
jgi:hypothetical protein